MLLVDLLLADEGHSDHILALHSRGSGQKGGCYL